MTFNPLEVTDFTTISGSSAEKITPVEVDTEALKSKQEPKKYKREQLTNIKRTEILSRMVIENQVGTRKMHFKTGLLYSNNHFKSSCMLGRLHIEPRMS